GSRPVRARLALPGGGQIVGHGRADKQRIEVRADVSDLSLDPVHAAVNGRLSGGLTVAVDLVERRAVLEGDARIERFRVVHPALAEGPVGPFNFGIGGRLTVEVPTRNPKKIKLLLEKGRASIGEVGVELTASLDNTGDALKVAADATVPPVDAGLATRAVPPGLLPNLQPFRLSGRFGFKGKLAIDMADLPATVLDADVDLKTLKVEEISDEIGFGRLKRIFYTRFEMPDGEVIVRETGPQSGRWTPLDLIPPLLPMAVTAQEDGGFYKHGGVSMLHLRGSLVRNLERGRFARGGSTLTMQLARNLFLNRRKTLSRKLEELVVTWLLERSFTKDELMELYLNVVEFGDHVFGIGEAARSYFHKAPRDLTPTEIAFLVRLLPSPRFYGKQFERGKIDASYGKRMKALLKRLVARGQLSAEVAEASQPELLWNGLQESPVPVPDWEDAPPEGAPPPDDPLDEW
ncbi:MAG: biosynthetic peptidoglycan transglycosylase, partial [bacterium]